MASAAAVFLRPRTFFRLGLLVCLLFQSLLPVWPFQHRLVEDKTLPLDHARQYMLELINRDRASHGLAPLTLDPVATRAAQAHSDEMAQWSYISHWDRQGRKPDQRYSEVGGSGAVFENVYTNHDIPFAGHQIPLASRQVFPGTEIEKAQDWFLHQVPPRDGHRRNLLDPNHNGVGIGISLSIDRKYGSRITVAQEFVNEFVSLASAPDEFIPGRRSRIAGRLPKNLTLHAVQICRERSPRPMSPWELKKTSAYTLPDQAVATLYPAPYRSAVPVDISKTSRGEEFSLTVRPGNKWTDGIYYVIVWVRHAGGRQPFIGSTRTVRFSAEPAVDVLAQLP